MPIFDELHHLDSPFQAFSLAIFIALVQKWCTVALQRLALALVKPCCLSNISAVLSQARCQSRLGPTVLPLVSYLGTTNALKLATWHGTKLSPRVNTQEEMTASEAGNEDEDAIILR